MIIIKKELLLKASRNKNLFQTGQKTDQRKLSQHTHTHAHTPNTCCQTLNESHLHVRMVLPGVGEGPQC